MIKQQNPISRRSFIRSSALAGGGLMLSFSWLNSFASDTKELLDIPDAVAELNGFLKIAARWHSNYYVSKSEGGQNVKTSMPMIVAEELDVDWKSVIVEQAPLNTRLYSRQFIGGSHAFSGLVGKR